MDKQQHLASLLAFLEAYGNREAHFDIIYNKLLVEYQSELLADDNLLKNIYLNNLRQTIEKQGEIYKAIKKKRPVKVAPSEFKSFISNFKQDVKEAISHLPKSA